MRRALECPSTGICCSSGALGQVVRASGTSTAVLISELSDPIATDQGPTLRSDGREVFFFSTRPGGLGGADLWTSTRRSVHDPWTPPVNAGAPLNSPAAEQQPSLSSGGLALLFASSPGGGFGGTYILMSAPAPGGP